MADTQAASPRRFGPCPKGVCDGTGFIYDEQADHMRDCECRPARLAARLVRGASEPIPRRYQTLVLGMLNGTPEALKHIEDEAPDEFTLVRRYCERITDHARQGLGLLITGPLAPGRRDDSKMLLAMAVCEEARKAELTVAVYSTAHLLARLRATLGDDGRRAGLELLDRLTSVDLLCLYDLAEPQMTEWAREQLYLIVDRRHKDRRAVVATSDLSPEDLPSRIGGRNAHLLGDICRHVEIDLGDEDEDG